MKLKLLGCAIVAFASGCAPPPNTDVTRLETGPSFEFNQTELDVREQAFALQRMAQALERRSRIKGAATGVAIGCGVALATGAHPAKCAASAAASGAIGAAVGHRFGKRQVQDRVDLVSANSLVRSLRGMNSAMIDISQSLPDLLREQDAELTNLQLRRDVGAISDQDYAHALTAIRDSRADLAQALSATAETAKLARANLAVADQQGQAGLEWHMLTTDGLIQDIRSARSSINLL